MRNKKSRTSIPVKLFIIFISACLITFFIMLYFQIQLNEVAIRIEEKNTIHTLIIITDNKGTLLFSDIFLFDTKTNRGALYNIPNNYGTIIDNLNKITRIDKIFYKSGINAYRHKIATILNLEIPYYLQFNTQNISNITDIIEGIKLNLSFSVSINNTEDVISLPLGDTLFDGDLIIQYLQNIKYISGDLEQLNYYWKFLYTYLIGIGNKSYLFSNKIASRLIHKNLKTNMNNPALQSYFNQISHLEVQNLILKRITGKISEVPSNDGSTEKLLFPQLSGQILANQLKKVEQELNNPVNTELHNTLRIEILNATPINHLAAETAQLFTNMKQFEIVSVRNAEKSSDRSLVIDRKGAGNKQLIDEMLAIIGIKNVAVEYNNALGVDITIILGSNFQLPKQ